MAFREFKESQEGGGNSVGDFKNAANSQAKRRRLVSVATYYNPDHSIHGRICIRAVHADANPVLTLHTAAALEVVKGILENLPDSVILDEELQRIISERIGRASGVQETQSESEGS